LGTGIKNETELKKYLDGFESQLENFATASNVASYSQYAGEATPAGTAGKIYGSGLTTLAGTENWQLIGEWLPKVQDAQLKRRLVMLNRIYLESAVSQTPAIESLRTQINAQLLRFQPQVAGRAINRSQVNQILRTNPDRAFRRYVFEQALKSLAQQLAPQVQELMHLRNSEARHLGYPDFAGLQLALAGLQSAQLLEMFDTLETSTDGLYSSFLKNAGTKSGLSQPQAWDLSWLAAQESLLSTAFFPADQMIIGVKSFLAEFGLDVDALPIKLVTREVPFGGLCYTVRIPDDIRILANPHDGYPYFRTLLHEFGHALHAAFNRQGFYSLKYESGLFNEAMAETLAYFSHSSEWLIQYTGLDHEKIAIYQQAGRFRRLLRLRTLMAQARFEVEAYQTPSQDLELLHARLESRYLQVPLNLTPRWAASSFPTTHPVYRQNYVIAEIIATQTQAALLSRFGDFWQAPPATRREIFRFLVENCYAPGASLDWQAKIEGVTGQNLNPTAWLDQFKIFKGYPRAGQFTTK